MVKILKVLLFFFLFNLYGEEHLIEDPDYNRLNLVIAGDSEATGFFFNKNKSYNSTIHDLYPGVLAWPNILKFSLLRNDPSFVHGDQLINLSSTKSNIKMIKNWKNSSDPYFLPFNNKNITLFNLSESSDVFFEFDNTLSKTDSIVIYFSKNPYSGACSFDLYCNEKMIFHSINTKGDVSYYKGFEPIVLEFQSEYKGIHRFRITNVKSVYDNYFGEMAIILNGIGTKYHKVINKARSSANTYYYIQSNQKKLNELLDLKPDILIMSIGNCDHRFDCTPIDEYYSGVVSYEEYRNNLDFIFNRLKNIIPTIIVIGPANWGGGSKEIISSYNLITASLALKYKIHYINLLDLSYKDPKIIDDYVHLSLYGHNIVSDYIINILRINIQWNIELKNSYVVY